MASPLLCSALRFFHDMTLLLVKLQFGNRSFISSLLTPVKLASRVTSDSVENGKLITGTDAKLVMEELGLWNSEDHTPGDYSGFADGAFMLLDEKEASLDEVEAAFAVFDNDKDGFISAEELLTVMGKLGLEEGMRLEDCKRMIGAFDEDGDGRIAFSEFKILLGFAK